MFTRPKRHVKKVYIHCSASDVKAHDNIETITKWHIDPKPPKGVKKTAGYGNGWKWVGYHYFIRKDGTIEEGRPLEEQPSAQGLYKGKYYNAETIAICLSGKKKEFFRQEQFDSLKNLCKEINYSYNKEITFHGHCEVSKKTCPVFDYKTILNLDEEGYIIPFPIAPLPLINNLNSVSAKFATTALSTQPKKKMAFPLLFLAAPLIKKLAILGFDKLKGKVLDKAKETVIKKILQKTGIDLGDHLSDQEKYDKINDTMNNLPPEQLLELKKEIIESESELLKAELENQTEQMAIVNRTMKAELKADDKWQRRWRPMNGFCFAITMSILLILFAILGFISVYTAKVDMVKGISELIFSFSPLIGVWSAVLGVSSYTRGKEKIEKLKKY